MVYLELCIEMDSENFSLYLASRLWGCGAILGECIDKKKIKNPVGAFLMLPDFSISQVVEISFVILFIFLNIIVSAYIIGTITLVVVRGDERTQEYRARMKSVQEYAIQHSIPKSVSDLMQEHVELDFRNREQSDERVLAFLPSTIRRKTLRHLYLGQLQSCYLFKGAKQKLLDAFLAAGRVELYMPLVRDQWQCCSLMPACGI